MTASPSRQFLIWYRGNRPPFPRFVISLRHCIVAILIVQSGSLFSTTSDMLICKPFALISIQHTSGVDSQGKSDTSVFPCGAMRQALWRRSLFYTA